MGTAGQGKMGTHQQKKLDDEALLAFRDRFALPLSDEDVAQLRFYHPGADSPEMNYLHRAARGARRLPAGARATQAPRRCRCRALAARRERNQSTTMVFVQLLVAAAARTRSSGRASCRSSPTRRAPSACRRCSARSASTRRSASSTSPRTTTSCSTTAKRRTARSSRKASPRRARCPRGSPRRLYSAHGMPMLPFYIYYSMFGFQRVGDLIWAAADSRARGFLVGATAGRTTLAGEGLQHQDGSSAPRRGDHPELPRLRPVLRLRARRDRRGRRAPHARSAGGRLLLRHGDERELRAARDAGGREGRHPARHVPADGEGKARLQLLGSGPILREVIAAAELLEKDWKISAARLERDLVHRAAPRRHAGGARDALRQAGEKLGRAVPGRDRRPGHRGERLRARGRRPDPAVRASANTWRSAPTASAAATRAPRCATSSKWMRATSPSRRSPRSTRA